MNELAEETKKLARLQAVELERTRLTASIKALPGEITQAQNLLKAAEKRVADSAAALKREELQRASLELEIEGHRAKAARFRGQMDTARNSAQANALEHEIAFAESEISRLEDNELASMEKSEALDTERAAALELAGKLSETLGLIRARVGEQDLEFREQLEALNAERVKLRSELANVDDGTRLAHFDRIATARGTGIAKAEAQQCSGCRMGIRPQVWNQLRDGLVLTCESCSRILYYDPTMAPAPPPKTAQSVSPAQTAGELGGSSIRRRAGV